MKFMISKNRYDRREESYNLSFILDDTATEDELLLVI